MAKTVITVETIDNDTLINSQVLEIPNTEAVAKIGNDTAKKKKKHKNANKVHWTVKDEVLLYKIADAGLLDKLHGVNFINGKPFYFFNKCEEVKAVIDKHNEENKPTEV